MVNEHHALAQGIEQVEAGECADNVLIRVEHGVAAVAAFQKNFLHVVQIVGEVEADDITRGGAYALYGDGLIDKARDLARVERG